MRTTLSTTRLTGRPTLAVIAALTTGLATVLIGPAAASAAPAPTPSATTPAPVTASAPASPATKTTDAKPTGTDSATSTTGSRATGPGGCGGKLAFGKVASCSSISGEEQDVWTVTSTVAQDTLYARLKGVSGEGVSAEVTDRNGDTVCFLGTYLSECGLGAAGTYTVTVSLYYGNGEGAYTLSAESMRTPSECDTLPENFFSFASAGRTGTLPAGLAARCFKFSQPTGTVLHLADPAGPGDVQGRVLNAEYQSGSCYVRYPTECTLTGSGPYRLFLEETYGNESAYTLKMPRLSHAVGCPALPLASFGDPGSVVGSGTVPASEGVSCQALTSAAPGAVVVRFNQFADQYLNWRVFDVDGRQVCDEYSAARSCALAAAGSYTLLAQNWNWEPVSYQVAVTALDRGDGCAAATGTAWDQPALVVHQTSPVQTNCQPFQGRAGDRVVVYRAPDSYNNAVTWLVDEHGTELCTEWSEDDGCALPGAGTYRVISYLANWDADRTDLTYRMQVRSLTDPTGCPTVTPGAYNAAPAGALGTVRCRVLDLPASGTYRVKAVGADNYRQWASVYDTAGHKLCTDVWCQVPAAGKYTLVLGGAAPDGVIDENFRYALALLPWTPSDCRPVPDTGWRDAPVRGEFTAAGQYDCLQLGSPAGSRIVELLPGDATGAGAPGMAVVDATGSTVCDSPWGIRQDPCQLTGQAPFSVVLDSRDGAPTGAYSLAFARTDGPPACPVLPADAAGATVTTGADRFAACFSIPADQHAARESFTWKRTGGTGDARIWIFNESGIRYCGPTPYAVERTVSCSLPAGAVTVFLETDAVNATYQLTHRDASLPAA
ncbi:hypothetical protein Q2K19_12325 [Micromonospora soli]|uniref:hypothetical protein n=1 Tax=Micromonospora sp. NBRC 110009 TaxID=3061627 RepID=UPI0026737441|nr:hypothetical protein [Micromonospora sp. NBRC 110009]WKU01190.1 hypothetical protein Q2K19_12325 [Micromonospora sp. NBRC 110009]